MCREDDKGATVVRVALILTVREIHQNSVVGAVHRECGARTVVLGGDVRGGDSHSCAHAHVEGGADVRELVRRDGRHIRGIEAVVREGWLAVDKRLVRAHAEVTVTDELRHAATTTMKSTHSEDACPPSLRRASARGLCARSRRPI